MPMYSYLCPHCDGVEMGFPMEPGPPSETPCPLCGEMATRVFVPVPVQYHAAGFTKSLSDRPDERLSAEIRASQDRDPVTGESWEEQDLRSARQRGRMGTLLRKDALLPPEGQSSKGVDFMRVEADRINRIVEEAK